MKYRTLLSLATLTVGLALPACGGSGWDPKAPQGNQSVSEYEDAVNTAVAMQDRDPSLREFFEDAHAFAIYPTVGKGGWGLGGSYGRGWVYRKGELIGSSSVTQVTAGFQFGGQAYSQVIFFRDAAALKEFTEGNYELGAQATAIAIVAGAAANASYDDGVAIFTAPQGGLMYEATVAGQKFSFEPRQDRGNG